MAITQKRLGGPTQLTTSSVAQYTVPISTTCIVKQMIMTNTTGSAKIVTVRLKPYNIAEANTHDILSSYTVNAYETISFSTSLVLVNNGSASSAANSDQIIAFCNSASSVNLTIVGIEES